MPMSDIEYKPLCLVYKMYTVLSSSFYYLPVFSAILFSEKVYTPGQS